MIKVARTDGNMIEPMLAAARAEATLGEMRNALRAEWGEYVEPPALLRKACILKPTYRCLRGL